jgi:hypothetical protein
MEGRHYIDTSMNNVINPLKSSHETAWLYLTRLIVARLVISSLEQFYRLLLSTYQSPSGLTIRPWRAWMLVRVKEP